MDALFKDIRYALRTLTRSPAFTAIAILTIGLGIGANTAIFSVVNAVLLRPLPYSEPDRLMLVWSEFTNRNLRNFPTSPPNLQDYREQSNYFEGFEGVITFQQALTGGDADPQQIQVGGVTPDFFAQLGVSPMLGRDFVDDDAAPIGVDAQGNPLATPPAAVVLSYGLWRARFGGESGVIGTTLELAGNAAERGGNF